MRHKVITFLGGFILFVIFVSAIGGNDTKTTSGSADTVKLADKKEVKKDLKKEGVSSDVTISVMGFETKETIGDNQFTKNNAQGI
jgi:hypothetical protein